MTDALTVGSLFAGIGGIELGLEWTGGFRTVWQVEKDEYCRRVLARHWPAAVRHEDVCTVGTHNLTDVDVICGGFPCQDISNAGKREGIDGARSGLWREYARIIRELRPHYVLVENVAALLGRGLGRVLGDLAAFGYDAEWEIVSAQEVGAPHLRERLFVVAYASSTRHESESRSMAKQARAESRQESRQSRCSSETLADPEGDGLAIGGPGHKGRDVDSARRINVRCQPVRSDSDAGTRIDADAACIGRGTRGARRSDSSSARESKQPLSLADAHVTRLEGLRTEWAGPERSASTRHAGSSSVGSGTSLAHSDDAEHERRSEGTRGRLGRTEATTGSGGFARASSSDEWWAVEPDVGRVAHGIPARLDRLRALGNAVVPQCAEYVGRKILEMEQLHAVA